MGGYKAFVRAASGAVSPWNGILPHFDAYVKLSEDWGFFVGIRNFVAEAATAPALADRFVHASTINMSIFRTEDPVTFRESIDHARFIVGPLSPTKVRLRFCPAGTQEPDAVWDVEPPEAIRIIAERFSE